ncbi:MAG: uroporphyrinogen decarboxylase family protein, partial [Candidatus Syntropharchaeia archaeon]
KVKKEKMTPADRMMLAMGLEEPDRVPVGFLPLTIGARMAGVTVDKFAKDGKLMAKGQMVFYEKFAPDFLLPFSDVPSVAEAWGTKSKFVEASTPYTVEFAVKKSEDWENIDRISASEWWERGRMPQILEAQDILIDKYESEVPILTLLVSPLTLASWIGGLSLVSRDMIKNPDLLHKGLNILAESMIELCKTYYDNGICVCYMAFTRATRDIYGPTQYYDFGIPYDLKVLNRCKSFMTFMGHVCGREPYLELLTPIYPLVGINFWDRGAAYDLEFAKKKYGDRIPLIGGVDQTRTLLYGTPEQVEAECIDAIQKAGPGGGFVLAPGCELSFETPDENIAAMVNAARKYGTYPLSEKVLNYKYEKPAKIGY